MQPKEKVNRQLNQLCLAIKDSVQKDLFNSRGRLNFDENTLKLVLTIVNQSVDAASMKALPKISDGIIASMVPQQPTTKSKMK